MKGLSRITLIGNLGKDPEKRFTASGAEVVQFTLAINKGKKDGEGKVNWYRVSVWGKMAEAVVQYLKKGSAVFVDGDLWLAEFTKADGTTGHSLEVNATQVQFLDKKPADNGEEVPF